MQTQEPSPDPDSAPGPKGEGRTENLAVRRMAEATEEEHSKESGRGWGA